MASSLRVAAVQPTSVNGSSETNLANAERLVHQVADEGAELVLCPEFLATGYLYDESLWTAGETLNGPTETWLVRLAKQHRLLIGAGFLEARGDHFFNTFTLCGPDGVVGRVRKASLPFFEGWYFTPSDDDKIIRTEALKIGVGICNDNQTAAFLTQMIEEQPDLILMPHSAPTPLVPLLDPPFASAFREQFSGIAPRFAAELGVPVILANKTSEVYRMPLPIVPGLGATVKFEGLSIICDAGGRVVAHAGSGEEGLVATVTLDPRRKRRPPLPTGYWSFPPARLARTGAGLLLLLDRLGRRAYRKNLRRAACARTIVDGRRAVKSSEGARSPARE